MREKEEEDEDEEAGEKSNISLKRWQRTSNLKPKTESETKRQRDRVKWVGMSPFIMPLLSPLTSVKNCHYVCHLIPDVHAE